MSPRTSRRTVMLGGAGSLALAAPAGVCALEARNSGAALIALGREHARIEQEQAEIEAAADRVGAAGGDVQPLNDRSDAINERMCFITENAAVLQARTAASSSGLTGWRSWPVKTRSGARLSPSPSTSTVGLY